MIHPFGQPDPPVPRLLGQLAERGHALGASPAASEARSGDGSTLVLAAGTDPDPMAVAALLGAWRKAPGARVLVVSALGAHPDARAPRLRRLWRLEEQARAAGIPVLTLRLAPLLGPRSPLWLRLRSRPPLPRQGRQVLNPVAESDVVETLDRALRGRARWEGWYEVAGSDALSLSELADLAAGTGPRLPAHVGGWEPPADELEEHRLAEAGPWLAHFGLAVRPVAELAGEWAA